MAQRHRLQLDVPKQHVHSWRHHEHALPDTYAMGTINTIHCGRPSLRRENGLHSARDSAGCSQNIWFVSLASNSILIFEFFCLTKKCQHVLEDAGPQEHMESIQFRDEAQNSVRSCAGELDPCFRSTSVTKNALVFVHTPQHPLMVTHQIFQALRRNNVTQFGTSATLLFRG